MKLLCTYVLSALGFVTVAASPALAGHGGWAIGINLGVPAYRPWYPGYGYYYAPYPVYYAPPPVIVQPAPVLQPVPATQSSCAAPAAAVVTAQAPAVRSDQVEIQQSLQSLSSGDERVRCESVMQLGRQRAEQALDPLAATLAGDRSPQVRE